MDTNFNSSYMLTCDTFWHLDGTVLTSVTMYHTVRIEHDIHDVQENCMLHELKHLHPLPLLVVVNRLGLTVLKNSTLSFFPVNILRFYVVLSVQIIMAKPAGGPKAPQEKKDWDEDD